MIKIKKSEDCCGCSACLSICNHNAIVFKEDVEGFKYPMIEEVNASIVDFVRWLVLFFIER